MWFEWMMHSQVFQTEVNINTIFTHAQTWNNLKFNTFILSRNQTWRSHNLRSPLSGVGVDQDLRCRPELPRNVAQSRRLSWCVSLTIMWSVQGGHMLLLQGLVLQLPRGLLMWRLPLLRVGGGSVLSQASHTITRLFMFSSKVATRTVTTRGRQQWFYASGLPKFLDRALGTKLSLFLKFSHIKAFS